MYQISKQKVTVNLPTPNGWLWESIRRHYHLPIPTPVDSVLSRVVLPFGWYVDEDKQVIYDQYTMFVGSYSIKKMWGEYNGYIFFEEERLEELGILIDE